MRINDLWIETTRRCNLKCKHCVRGDAQKLDMSSKVIEKFILGIKSIKRVCFSGGEPTLNPKAVKQFINVVKKHNVKVDHFVVAINGTIFSKKFLSYLDELYELCEQKDQCEVGISRDRFHAFNNDVCWNYYDNKREYTGNTIGRILLDDSNIVRMGRAKENNLGDITWWKHNATDKYSRKINKDGEIEIGPYSVYLSCSGEVVSCNGLSYDLMEKYSRGNVLKSDIVSILLKNSKEEKVW